VGNALAMIHVQNSKLKTTPLLHQMCWYSKFWVFGFWDVRKILQFEKKPTKSVSFGGNESRPTVSVVTKSYTDPDTTSAGRRFSLVRSTGVGLEANTDGDSSVHSENTVVTNADGPVEGEKFLFYTKFCK
jgi:hypothetical protein